MPGIAPAFLAQAAGPEERKTTTALATSLTATVVHCARAVCSSAPNVRSTTMPSLLGTFYWEGLYHAIDKYIQKPFPLQKVRSYIVPLYSLVSHVYKLRMMLILEPIYTSHREEKDSLDSDWYQPQTVFVLLRRATVIRTHDVHKNPHIPLFLSTIFGPGNYVFPSSGVWGEFGWVGASCSLFPIWNQSRPTKKKNAVGKSGPIVCHF